MAATGCHEAPTTLSELRQVAPEVNALGEVCADVGAQRVCWRGSKSLVVRRAVPNTAAPRDGWRCGGMGSERVCEDRSRNASRFSCGTQRCLQVRPRMPDDGEWDCVEISGVAYCRSRGPVAGMDGGPMDLGWLCGARRKGANGERICVDLDADRPKPTETFRCRYELQNGAATRSCVETREPMLGSACRPSEKCPTGTICSSGLCLPGRPAPACWLEADCDSGERCVLGTCAAVGA